MTDFKKHIVQKMLELMQELRTIDPDARYLTITYMDNVIAFSNDYFEREEAVTLTDCAYELNYAREVFGDIDPTLTNILTFEGSSIND